jgi:hypothetical protein
VFRRRLERQRFKDIDTPTSNAFLLGDRSPVAFVFALAFLAPSYTHRPRCRGPHVGGGFSNNFSIPHFGFVCKILKTYSRSYKVHPYSHVGRFHPPRPQHDYAELPRPAARCVERLPYTDLAYPTPNLRTLYLRTLHQTYVPYTYVPYTKLTYPIPTYPAPAYPTPTCHP